MSLNNIYLVERLQELTLNGVSLIKSLLKSLVPQMPTHKTLQCLAYTLNLNIVFTLLEEVSLDNIVKFIILILTLFLILQELIFLSPLLHLLIKKLSNKPSNWLFLYLLIEFSLSNRKLSLEIKLPNSLVLISMLIHLLLDLIQQIIVLLLMN